MTTPRKRPRIGEEGIQKLKQHLVSRSLSDSQNLNAIYFLERDDWSEVDRLLKLGIPLSEELALTIEKKINQNKRGRPKKIQTDDNLILGVFIFLQVQLYGRNVETVIQDVISDLQKKQTNYRAKTPNIAEGIL